MDRRLRSLILEYLLLLETHLKSAISYKFCEKFPEQNSYLDIQNYSSDNEKIIDKVSVIANLSGVIKRNIKKESFSNNQTLNSIEHYLKKSSRSSFMGVSQLFNYRKYLLLLQSSRQ